MTEQDNPYTHSASINCMVVMPEEQVHNSIRVRKAFYLGRLYICALARGWDDIASYLLDTLHALGFDIKKFTDEWKLIDTGKRGDEANDKTEDDEKK